MQHAPVEHFAALVANAELHRRLFTFHVAVGGLAVLFVVSDQDRHRIETDAILARGLAVLVDGIVHPQLIEPGLVGAIY